MALRKPLWASVMLSAQTTRTTCPGPVVYTFYIFLRAGARSHATDDARPRRSRLRSLGIPPLCRLGLGVQGCGVGEPRRASRVVDVVGRAVSGES